MSTMNTFKSLTVWAIPILLLCLAVFAVPAAAQEAGAAGIVAAGTDQPDPDARQPPTSFATYFERLDLAGLLEANTYVEWLTLLGAILVGLVIGRILGYILRKSGQRTYDRGWHVLGHVLMDLAGPAALGLLTMGLMFGLGRLHLTEDMRVFTLQIIKLLYYIAFFWYAYNLVSVIELFLTRLAARTKSDLDDQLVPLVRKSLRVFLVVVAALFIAQNVLGANIASWLAGLGIAGLAVSLAAQDSLKNLFGSITIFLDQPFLVGDFIKYGEDVGTVEEIGFRSTKIRTLDGHVVTIPNSLIVNDPVTNIGRRPHIRRVLNVTVTYDTPPAKIDEGIQILREIFQLDGIRQAIHDPEEPDNPDKFPPRVYFNDFNAASLNIVVYYWHRPGVWWDYLEHAHRFDMELLQRFNDAGIDFAFPTQTLYLAGDEKRQLTVNVQQAARPQ